MSYTTAWTTKQTNLQQVSLEEVEMIDEEDVNGEKFDKVR